MNRLLILAPSYPFPARDGVQLRLGNVLRRLGPDYDLALAGFAAVPARKVEALPEPLRGEGVLIPQPRPAVGWRSGPVAQVLRPEASLLWKFVSPVMAGEVRARAFDADAVLAVGLQMGQYLRHVPSDVPTALDNYNVESLILARMARLRPGWKRWYWRREAAKLRRAERRLMTLAGTVFAISDVDRAGLARIAPRARLVTVPMGIDREHFSDPAGEERGGEEAPPVFTFPGAFHWHVNADAADWLCRRVWPRVRAALPGAQLCLVGRDPSPAVRAHSHVDSVLVTGTVPDVRPFLWRSRAVLVPLRYGSGVRTKILEAFAAGRPVVSTTVGCEGLPVRSGEHLLVADDEDGFATACVRLVREPELAARLTTAAAGLVADIDDEACERLRQAMRAVVSEHAARPAAPEKASETRLAAAD